MVKGLTILHTPDPLYRYGPIPMGTAPKHPCTQPDCDRPQYARDLCSTHYKRWQRWGDASYTSPRTTRKAGKVGTTRDGYHTFRGQRAHRLVLYNVIGYGPHRCHWCRRPINWRWDTVSDWTHVLVVDHLNHDRTDNDPDNLVASCQSCNGRRIRRTETQRDWARRNLPRQRKRPQVET